MIDKGEYTVNRTCKACGNVDMFPISKREAAFDLYDRYLSWHSECSRCGSKECASLGRSFVKLDKQLLLEWAGNENLRIDDQDEEVILGGKEYVELDVLLDVLDNYDILPNKKKIIIEAMCVVVHDYRIRSR